MVSTDKSAVAVPASAHKKTQKGEILHLAQRQSSQVGVLKSAEAAAATTTSTTQESSTHVTPQQHEKLDKTLEVQVKTVELHVAIISSVCLCFN